MFEKPISHPMEDEPPVTSGNPLGKLLLVTILATAAIVGWRYLGPSSASARDGWMEDWDAAVAQSRQTGKPALVLFTADWCPACKQFESEVLSRSEVAKYLKARYTLVIVDLTHRSGPNTERAGEFGIRAVPTLIKYDRAGREVGRANGMSADALLRWLGAGRS